MNPRNWKSWKTTFFGILGAAATVIIAEQKLFENYPWIVFAARVAMATGIAGIGIHAQDKDEPSARGETGETGATGATGPAGPAGIAGPTRKE